MRSKSPKKLIRAGVILGFGLGGFIDGILFHQILQLHAMLSAKLPKVSLVNMQANMFWDGIFHFVTWTATVAGIFSLYHATQEGTQKGDGKIIIFAAILGWGLFNFLEGIINHHILQLHHVVESFGLSIYDYAFLASGVIFVITGWLGMRLGKIQKQGEPAR